MLCTASAVLALAGAAALSPDPAFVTSRPVDQAHEAQPFTVVSDSQIIADGVTYDSWQALADSGYFHLAQTRCKTDTRMLPDDLARGSSGSSNCSGSRTVITPDYEPAGIVYRIPVVVHILSSSNGTGNLPDSRVHSQIEILNEDFRALKGSNGALGNDAQIEFYLATQDPDGNPTTGITRSTNTTWFNDGGAYYNTLAWDPDRYLNIYTNTASGNLGYVPTLPQGGIVGSPNDRVVILYTTFGRNAPFSPFNLGRTVTHEVGHYLGLDHTFAGGCSSGNGYTTGDLIADTNPESSPTFGCPGSRTSCGLPAPFNNYMDYADDICMTQFTPEQNNRMRCTLVNYRPDLYEIATKGPECSPVDLAEPYGVLNFFDASAFIGLFMDGDPSADLNGDNDLNFFDVSEFFAYYNQGCP